MWELRGLVLLRWGLCSISPGKLYVNLQLYIMALSSHQSIPGYIVFHVSRNYIVHTHCPVANSSGSRAMYGVRLRPLQCWDCGFESRREWISLLGVVFCYVEVSASGWSLVHRSTNECGVSECNREASLMRRFWPTGSCCAVEKIYIPTAVPIGNS